VLGEGDEEAAAAVVVEAEVAEAASVVVSFFLEASCSTSSVNPHLTLPATAYIDTDVVDDTGELRTKGCPQRRCQNLRSTVFVFHFLRHPLCSPGPSSWTMGIERGSVQYTVPAGIHCTG
jgi:hypothetical protein